MNLRHHALFDYMLALLLVTSPWFLPYPDDITQTIGIGGGVIIGGYNAITKQPPSLIEILPFSIHRFLDLVVGVALAGAPLHFATHGAPAILFVVCGSVLVIVSFLTRKGQTSGTTATE
jgi:hypothetical protein